jgi:PadR family transcriptional regulator PadR
MLGEFEYMLITAAVTLGDSAYGATIRKKIEDATKVSCAIGAIYTTIDRLEAKGYLRTWMGESTAQRGGRAKRMVEATPAGVKAAKEFYSAVMRVSRAASWVPGQAGGPI